MLFVYNLRYKLNKIRRVHFLPYRYLVVQLTIIVISIFVANRSDWHPEMKLNTPALLRSQIISWGDFFLAFRGMRYRVRSYWKITSANLSKFRLFLTYYIFMTRREIKLHVYLEQ